MKSNLERLIRPDTHDEARAFSDEELKAAADKAVNELRRRGWNLRGYLMLPAPKALHFEKTKTL